MRINKLAIIILLLLLTACSPHDYSDYFDDYNETALTDKQKESTYNAWLIWRDEELSNSPRLPRPPFHDIQSSATWAVNASRKMVYYKSNLFHWQDSAETIELKSGVCIDTAILAYMILYDAGYDESQYTIMGWFLDNGIGHVELCIFIDGYWCMLIDGYWQKIPCVPAMMFNINYIEFL